MRARGIFCSRKQFYSIGLASIENRGKYIHVKMYSFALPHLFGYKTGFSPGSMTANI